MRKSWILLTIMALIVPFLFMGCDGSDGATGSAGPPGPPGPPGSGAVASESCVVCHGDGDIADLVTAHANAIEQYATVTITGVTIASPPVVDFTVAFPTGSTANPATLTGDNFRFTIAKLVPAAAGSGDPDRWESYIYDANGLPDRESGIDGTLVNNGGGSYTYTFATDIDNTAQTNGVVYEGDLTHRVGMELRGSIPRGDAVSDLVPAPPLRAGAPATRTIVTTAACNQCHDPLAFHGNGRFQTDLCVLCHNPGLPDDGNLVALVHKIHSADNNTVIGPDTFDFSEVTYPQDLTNCTTCHQGGADSGNWNTRPSIQACGSCHTNVNFATGQGHSAANFPQADNSGCAVSFCHGSATLQPSFVHRTENVTPNNPQLPPGLGEFAYFLDNVAVDNNGVATIGFRFTLDGAPFDLANVPSAGFTSRTPGFLLAWALPQDDATSPADYNNLNSPQSPSGSTGNGAGQPPSISISDLITDNLVSGTAAGYTAVLANDPFPAGATMRAVALQGYFEQIVGTENIGRHTPSVMLSVPGDAVRRVVVKSGYVGGQPVGCLECHEIFEGHGGNRVNNVQVCVFCHNPNLSTSGRTVDPARANPDTVAALGPDPLTWPEATNNMKSLIHGIHAAPVRTNPFEFVRNRSNGLYYNWSEVTFPGNLRDCQKCHDGVTYDADLPPGQLLSTERITTGDPAETREDIIAARGVMPNDTDLVTTPLTAACVYCHDSSAATSHFVLNGAAIKSTRADVLLGP